MCILANENTRIIVQGITGSAGSGQTRLMLDYGSKIVAGVTPGKGGMTVHGIPVYDTMKEAVANNPAEAAISFVPTRSTKEAVIEAADSGIRLIVAVTEHVPVHDVIRMREYSERSNVTMIGPTTPGIICPGKTKIGIMPASLFVEGEVGIVSRSGTLLYEIAGNLSSAGIGQSSCLGIGADLVVGTRMRDILKLFEEDEHTKLVTIVGEIGGTQEEDAAAYIESEMKKPVIAYVAGRTAPEGQKMGHAGAIVLGEKGTAGAKIDVLRKAGAAIASKPSEIPEIAKACLARL